MAAMENKTASALVIKKVVETSGDGKEKYRSQKFSKIKTAAVAQDIYDVAKAMTELIVYPIKEILREDTSSIING